MWKHTKENYKAVESLNSIKNTETKLGFRSMVSSV